ncbi:MAG: Flp family type IVb pilin [Nocardioidaceae bacterium]|nr:Flp family type IVb pilin [Nocardioidaceae bacterium]MCL2615005.1 Flp family type IVb pilin [Nocardioidaceae bacterium]
MVQYLQILLNARLSKMEERGASAVEYGLLVALIAAVIIGIVIVLGKQLNNAFTGVSTSLDNAGVHS